MLPPVFSVNSIQPVFFAGKRKWVSQDNGQAVCSVQALLDAHIEETQINAQGETALIKGVPYKGNNAVVPTLIQAGMPINAVDQDGQTALEYAERHHPAICWHGLLKWRQIAG